MLLLFLFFTSIPLYFSAVSFSPSGNWTLSRNPEKECVHEFLCTWNNMTWYADNMIPSSDHDEGVYDQINSVKAMDSTYSPFFFFNSSTGCKALIDKGITLITFHGDSYMRQMYSGMLLLLSGNYRNGTLIQDPKSIGCEYYKQLYEKGCGVQQLNHNGLVCDGKVRLDPLLYVPTNLGMCHKTEKTVVLLSTGNHKTRSGFGGRYGINNATIYQELFESMNLCPSFRANDNPKCSTYWISTHYRVIGWFPDETPEHIKTYNEEMREFFESGKCGKTGYIDVYNMTRQMAVHHPNEASTLTFDRVHWGMQVNLLKAQFILNTILFAP